MEHSYSLKTSLARCNMYVIVVVSGAMRGSLWHKSTIYFLSHIEEQYSYQYTNDIFVSSRIDASIGLQVHVRGDIYVHELHRQEALTTLQYSLSQVMASNISMDCRSNDVAVCLRDFLLGHANSSCPHMTVLTSAAFCQAVKLVD